MRRCKRNEEAIEISAKGTAKVYCRRSFQDQPQNDLWATKYFYHILYRGGTVQFEFYVVFI